MHMRRNLPFAAALVLGIGTAYAADVPNFNQMDKDNDGALTRSEAAGNPRLLAHFAQVDDDSNGTISRAEYLQVMARRDLHTLRENLAEFIQPDGKPPLATGQQAGGEQQVPQVPMAASSQLVRSVQQQLQAKGVDPGPIDGMWGPQTHQGLRDFQQAEGLEPNGQLNGRTLAALGIPDSASAAAGQSASAGGTAQGGTLFERVDKDDDGFVSRSEYDAMKQNGAFK